FDSVEVLKDINLTVSQGQTFCLLGNSGSGKTTLLKLINKLIVSDKGNIYVDGENVNHTNEKALRKKMGYVIQNGGLFPHMKVGANIALPLRLMNKPKEEIHDRIRVLIDQIGLDETFLDRYPETLSGGQRQRVGIARAIANKPNLLLLDEPFSALDPVLREQMQNDFLKMDFLRAVTKVIVTHDLKEAIKLGDVICLMEHGRVVFTGTSREFLTSELATVKKYIGDENFNLTIGSIKPGELLITPLAETDVPESAKPFRFSKHSTMYELLNSRSDILYDEIQNTYYSRESVKSAFLNHLKTIL
ncbi:MAG: ATP-binding cassette domain-containing protein, partial [Cyclobacteriaceae bacterium]